MRADKHLCVALRKFDVYQSRPLISRRKVSSIPFRAFPHPISLSYFEKVIAIYQSRAFLLSSTARTQELFFAVSRAAEREEQWVVVREDDPLYITSLCRPFLLHCGFNRRCRKRKNAFFLLQARFKRSLPGVMARRRSIFFNSPPPETRQIIFFRGETLRVRVTHVSL